MPTLVKRKKASTSLDDYGSLADVVTAMNRAAGAVAQAEQEETDAILAHPAPLTLPSSDRRSSEPQAPSPRLPPRSR